MSNIIMQGCALRNNSSVRTATAFLDLNNGHLTDESFIPDFRPASRGVFPENDPKNWFCSPGGVDHSLDYQFVAKIQPFQAGGYEMTITRQDLRGIARVMDCDHSTGKREKTEQKEDDIESSIQRSKRKVRHLIKSMGSDRLLTLTRRESDPEEFWTVEQWAAAWDRFRRAIKKLTGQPLQYVAVLERHKKGNLHLHAAIVGHLNVNHIRKIWLSIVGNGQKGAGNIDIKFRQDLPTSERLRRIAKYVSKYITKDAGMTEFNKKRYWSTRHKLPAVRRYILNTVEIRESLAEICRIYGLDIGLVFKKSFITENVAWFSFDESLLSEPPF